MTDPNQESATVPEMHFDGVEIDSVKLVGPKLKPNQISIHFRDYSALSYSPELFTFTRGIIPIISGKKSTWFRVGKKKVDLNSDLSRNERLELEERRSIMAEISGMESFVKTSPLLETLSRVHLAHLANFIQLKDGDDYEEFNG